MGYGPGAAARPPRHLHPVRTAIRQIDMDDDLTMLIGPAHDGTLLEIGVLDLNGEDPVVVHAMRLRPKFYRSSGKGDHVKQTDAEIEDAARRFEHLATTLTRPAWRRKTCQTCGRWPRPTEQVCRDEALVTERVAAARAGGRSWNRIAVALGVSRAGRPPPVRGQDRLTRFPDRATKPPAIRPGEGAWR
jgi:hypothetical protein